MDSLDNAFNCVCNVAGKLIIAGLKQKCNCIKNKVLQMIHKVFKAQTKKTLYMSCERINRYALIAFQLLPDFNIIPFFFKDDNETIKFERLMMEFNYLESGLLYVMLYVMLAAIVVIIRAKQ